MMVPYGFEVAASQAHNQEALTELDDSFSLFHAEHIAPLEAEVRAGAVALLATAGTRVDAHFMSGYFEHGSLSTGFLVAGEIQNDGPLHQYPVIRIDAQLPPKRRDAILDYAFQRDRRLNLPVHRNFRIKQLTKLLQHTPLRITAGTVRNQPPEEAEFVGRGKGWQRFSQVTTRNMRPKYGHDFTLTGLIGRRFLGEVVNGYFRPEDAFTDQGGWQRYQLENPPLNALPRLAIRPRERNLLAMTTDQALRDAVFEVKRQQALEDTVAARQLFHNVAIAAATVVKGKQGRQYWYGDSSRRNNFRTPLPAPELDIHILTD